MMIQFEQKRELEEQPMWIVKSTIRLARPAPTRHESRRPRSKQFSLLTVALPVLLFAGVSSAQYPLLDEAANRVVQKYQNSPCEQLWQQRGRPKSEREQRAVDFLHSDPQMRRMFIDRVAAPIANKLFECGMIP
jgi:hypothetical protein